ncbi:hypothetical protein ACFCV3_41940 [Kribbella sp. NPDC056345]|uniref:hypothetical protein n=1 Tax=Kribbella sp. NPDC056345 TaxID=3345789 RepID=UPI0035DB7879
MKIDYTPDRTSRSYRAGGILAKAVAVGTVVSVLAGMAKAAGASLPWVLVLLPALIPFALAMLVFAALGFIVAVIVGARG